LSQDSGLSRASLISGARRVAHSQSPRKQQGPLQRVAGAGKPGTKNGFDLKLNLQAVKCDQTDNDQRAADVSPLLRSARRVPVKKHRNSNNPFSDSKNSSFLDFGCVSPLLRGAQRDESVLNEYGNYE